MLPQPNDTPEPLIRDFIGWLDRTPRTYSEAIDAWRTSCPRLTVWEEAFHRGLVIRAVKSGTPYIVVTAAGRATLSDHPTAEPRNAFWPIRMLRIYFGALRSLRLFENAIRSGRVDEFREQMNPVAMPPDPKKHSDGPITPV